MNLQKTKMVARPRNHQQMEKAEPWISYVGVLEDPCWAHQTIWCLRITRGTCGVAVFEGSDQRRLLTVVDRAAMLGLKESGDTFLRWFYVHWVFSLHVWMCTLCVPDVWGDQKRMLNLLGLELKVVVSCHGAETRTWVFWKSTQYC